MAKFAVAFLALLASVNAAAVSPREFTCPPDTAICGYDALSKYGATEADLRIRTPEHVSDIWSTRYWCGPGNYISLYLDTCNPGKCVGDHLRPGFDDAFCE